VYETTKVVFEMDRDELNTIVGDVIERNEITDNYIFINEKLTNMLRNRIEERDEDGNDGDGIVVLQLRRKGSRVIQPYHCGLETETMEEV